MTYVIIQIKLLAEDFITIIVHFKSNNKMTKTPDLTIRGFQFFIYNRVRCGNTAFGLAAKTAYQSSR
jgi:hypothetical protein